MGPRQRWRDIPGWEGVYQASDYGQIRSLERSTTFVRGGRQITRRVPAKVLSPTPRADGYLVVNLQEGGRLLGTQVQRLVLLAFRGPCPEGYEASHLNGRPWDNRLRNLVWETRKENFARKREHGTYGLKLTEAQVSEIRRRRRSGETLVSIAKRFGVDKTNVSAICLHKTWA